MKNALVTRWKKTDRLTALMSPSEMSTIHVRQWIRSDIEEREMFLLPQLHIKEKVCVRHILSISSSLLFVAIHESALNLVIAAYSSLMIHEQ